MPVKRKKKITKQQGEGLLDIFKGVGKFLKDTKLISGLAGVASAVPGLAGIAAPVAGVAGALGFGMKPRRRRKCAVKKKAPKKKRGAGLGNPGGGALRLAGRRQVYR